MAEVISGRELFVLVMFILGPVFCSDVPVDVYVKTGDNCTLVPKVKGKLQTILWKYQGNKVVELEPSEYRWYKFQDQAQLNNGTGVLTLLKLDKKRIGPYQSEIQVDGKLYNTNFNVDVMDPVPVPEVTCKRNDTDTTILCSVGSSFKAALEWSGPTGITHGERVSVPQDQDRQSVYICTAKNKVSEKSKEFSLKECFQDEPPSSNTTAIIVAVVVVAIIAIIVIVGIVLWKIKQNRSQKVTQENGGEGGNPETEGVVLLSCKETIHAEEPHSEDKVKSSSNKAEVEGLAKLTTEAGLLLLNDPEKTHAEYTFAEEPNKVGNAIDKAALNHNETTETTFLAEEPQNKVGNATGEDGMPLSINETTNAEHIVAEEPGSDDKVKSSNSEADDGQKEEKDDEDTEDTAPKEPHNEVGTETGKDADPVENGMDTTHVASEVAEEA